VFLALGAPDIEEHYGLKTGGGESHLRVIDAPAGKLVQVFLARKGCELGGRPWWDLDPYRVQAAGVAAEAPARSCRGRRSVLAGDAFAEAGDEESNLEDDALLGEVRAVTEDLDALRRTLPARVAQRVGIERGGYNIPAPNVAASPETAAAGLTSAPRGVKSKERAAEARGRGALATRSRPAPLETETPGRPRPAEPAGPLAAAAAEDFNQYSLSPSDSTSPNSRQRSTSSSPASYLAERRGVALSPIETHPAWAESRFEDELPVPDNAKEREEQMVSLREQASWRLAGHSLRCTWPGAEEVARRFSDLDDLESE